MTRQYLALVVVEGEEGLEMSVLGDEVVVVEDKEHLTDFSLGVEVEVEVEVGVEVGVGRL